MVGRWWNHDRLRCLSNRRIDRIRRDNPTESRARNIILLDIGDIGHRRITRGMRTNWHSVRFTQAFSHELTIIILDSKRQRWCTLADCRRKIFIDIVGYNNNIIVYGAGHRIYRWTKQSNNNNCTVWVFVFSQVESHASVEGATYPGHHRRSSAVTVVVSRRRSASCRCFFFPFPTSPPIAARHLPAFE